MRCLRSQRNERHHCRLRRERCPGFASRERLGKWSKRAEHWRRSSARWEQRRNVFANAELARSLFDGRRRLGRAARRRRRGPALRALTSHDPATPGPDAVAVAPVAPDWTTSNTSTSKWISVNTGTTGANAGDTYQYTTTFNLSGADPTTATLAGTWACDDSCTMQLNGAEVAGYALPAWESVAPFNVPAGSPFKIGTNTLTITVPNSDVFATGLQIVSISGSASANPVSSGTGGTGGGNNGGVTTGQTLSTGPLDFCVVAPWNDSPEQFVSSTGATSIPAGAYTLRYVGGAQNHDEYQQYGGNYEVSAHYAIDGLEAGHHIYDGADPYSSVTSVWLDTSGLVGDLPDVATVESTNAGHTWPIALAGGPLFVTYYDNDYSDNIGPGTELCIDASQQSDSPKAKVNGRSEQRVRKGEVVRGSRERHGRRERSVLRAAIKPRRTWRAQTADHEVVETVAVDVTRTSNGIAERAERTVGQRRQDQRRCCEAG